MKILNLLEGPYQTNVVDKKTNRPLKQFSQKLPDVGMDDKNTPYGVFSMVKPDIDPHMVKKSSRHAMNYSEDEGFKAFIMFLINNNYTDNIHMPRVYDVTTIKGNDGYGIDTYKVEKLLHGNEIDNHLLTTYLKSLLLDDILDTLDEDNIINYPNQLLANYISRDVGLKTKSFKSDELNEACRIVAQAIHATGKSSDIHFNNIMYRRTPTGIQVVINDPLF